MKYLSEDEFVRAYGDKAQIEEYEKAGKLSGRCRSVCVKRAKKYCDVEVIYVSKSVTKYKLKKFKKFPDDKNSRRVVTGVYKYLCPLIVRQFADNDYTILSFDSILKSIKIVSNGYYFVTFQIRKASLYFGYTYEEVFDFAIHFKNILRYYIDAAMINLKNSKYINFECLKKNDDSQIHYKCDTYSIKGIDKGLCEKYLARYKSEDYSKKRAITELTNIYEKSMKNRNLSDKQIDIQRRLLDVCFEGNDIYLDSTVEYKICPYGFNCEICDEISPLKSKESALPFSCDNQQVYNRESPEYKDWVNKVLERDNYTCQCCGSTINPQAHHIYNYSQYPLLRCELNNGITLCESCHAPYILGSFHNVFGMRNNSKEQLDLYMEKYGKIRMAIQNAIDSVIKNS